MIFLEKFAAFLLWLCVFACHGWQVFINKSLCFIEYSSIVRNLGFKWFLCPFRSIVSISLKYLICTFANYKYVRGEMDFIWWGSVKEVVPGVLGGPIMLGCYLKAMGNALKEDQIAFRRPRRNQSTAFKAKVAIAAVEGEKTLAPISNQFDLHT